MALQPKPRQDAKKIFPKPLDETGGTTHSHFMTQKENENNVGGTEDYLGLDLNEFGLTPSKLAADKKNYAILIKHYTKKRTYLENEMIEVGYHLKENEREFKIVESRELAVQRLLDPSYVKAFVEEIQRDPVIQDRKIPVNSLGDILNFLSREDEGMRKISIGIILNHLTAYRNPEYAGDMMKDYLLGMSFSEENRQANITHVSPDFYTLYRKGYIRATPKEIKAIACQGFEEDVNQFNIEGNAYDYKHMELKIRGTKNDKNFNIETAFMMAEPFEDGRHMKTTLGSIHFSKGTSYWSRVEEREFQKTFVRNMIGLADKVSPDGILNIGREAGYELPWFAGILAQDDALLKKTSVYDEVKRKIKIGQRIFNLNTGELTLPSRNLER